MTENWLCWIYQYGVGGLLFAGALALAWSRRVLRPADPADRKLLATLVAGYFAFAVVHGLWIFLAG